MSKTIFGSIAISADPDQTAHLGQFDLDLYCVLRHCCLNMIMMRSSGPKVVKLFSTQLSMKSALPINLELLTTANSFLLNIANGKTNIAEQENFSANKYENANYYCCCFFFHIYLQRNFMLS